MPLPVSFSADYIFMVALQNAMPQGLDGPANGSYDANVTITPSLAACRDGASSEICVPLIVDFSGEINNFTYSFNLSIVLPYSVASVVLHNQTVQLIRDGVIPAPTSRRLLRSSPEFEPHARMLNDDGCHRTASYDRATRTLTQRICSRGRYTVFVSGGVSRGGSDGDDVPVIVGPGGDNDKTDDGSTAGSTIPMPIYIVLGCVGGLALLTIGAVFVLRRSKVANPELIRKGQISPLQMSSASCADMKQAASWSNSGSAPTLPRTRENSASESSDDSDTDSDSGSDSSHSGNDSDTSSDGSDSSYSSDEDRPRKQQEFRAAVPLSPRMHVTIGHLNYANSFGHSSSPVAAARVNPHSAMLSTTPRAWE